MENAESKFHCPNCGGDEICLNETLTRRWMVNKRLNELGQKMTGSKIPQNTSRKAYFVFCYNCNTEFWPQRDTAFACSIEDFLFGSVTDQEPAL